MYRLKAALWKLRGSLYLSRMRSLKRMIKVWGTGLLPQWIVPDRSLLVAESLLLAHL